MRSICNRVVSFGFTIVAGTYHECEGSKNTVAYEFCSQGGWYLNVKKQENYHYKNSSYLALITD